MTPNPFVPSDVNPGVLHPIIYVRGYAMTRGEINETTADPFCGFNIGSTVYRATPERDRPARKFIFESPVVRLAKDFGYRDVYIDGEDIADHEAWDQGISRQSIVVFRYYESASTLLGAGVTPSITDFAKALSALIARTRTLALRGDPTYPPDGFRCYLVAHSMGGLVCRTMLQNPDCDPHDARKLVDKFFTYATPHNGIDLAGRNVPSWLTLNDVDNFSRGTMREYLGLTGVFPSQYWDGKDYRVDWIPEDRFPSRKMFCLVGTNRLDYESAQGLSRTFAGDGSDGLVRIENAVACGTASGTPSSPTALAFVYRAHSGFFGIVNSEDSYQNLTRFLFGDVRVDIWLDIDELKLPAAVVKAAGGRTDAIDALYQIEILASPRGKLWYLTRRTAEEDSAACLRHQDFVTAKKPVSKHVSTVFLANRGRVRADRKSLAYSMTLGIRVPDYEINRRLWIDDHFEGGYLYRDALLVELFPPDDESGRWRVEYDWQKDNLTADNRHVDTKELASGEVKIEIPFEREGEPGAKGRVRFVVSLWNV
jgi:hypothetical protein